MAKLICKIKLGVLNQDILIQDNDNITSYEMPIKDISHFIINREDITDVYLGGTGAFTKKIEDDTREEELKKYSITKIKFHYI